MKMLRVHFPGIHCSDMCPRGNWYFYNCATPIFGGYFASAKCRTQFNLLNFMGHLAGTKYHIHATRPCYMSPQCALKFFVASTCPCDMTPRVCSPLARREHRTVNLSFSTFNSTGIPPVHFYYILCQQYRGEQEGIIKK